MSIIAQIQSLAGVPADGNYGPVTDAAITRYIQTDPSFVLELQSLLGVPADGDWGARSSAALKCAIFGLSLLAPNVTFGTSFADPADVAAYDAAIARGMSPEEALAIGDNGIGCYNNKTREGSGPQVALPPEFMLARFGGEAQAQGQPIKISLNGKTVVAKIGDVMPHLGEEPSGALIDNNPDVVRALGLEPPMKTTLTWQA
jgi:hypothetical protein